MASVTVPLLGHRIEIASEDARVLRLAADAFGAWRQLPGDLVSLSPPARVDIQIQNGGACTELPTQADWRRDGSIFEARAGATRLRVDVAGRAAWCTTDEAALGDADWFGWHVLAPARLLATLDDRLPLHAAGVVLGERAALLVGPSGSGKSTTAYACHRAGLDVLSEDTVFLSRAGTPRLWGYTDRYYLSHDSTRWFPEIVHSPLRQRPNGKLRRAIAAGNIRPRLSVSIEPVVVLIDRSSDVVCEEVSPAEWHDYLARPLESGFDLYEAAWLSAQSQLMTWRAFRVGTRSGPIAAAASIVSLLSPQM